MKIKTKVLTDFFKKIGMQGNEKIEEAIFNFTEIGLKVVASSVTKTCRIDGVLLKQAFAEYEAIGKVGIQDISNIRKIIDKFEEDISFFIEGNVIKFSSNNKEMITELIDVQFIQEPTELKEMQHDEIFPIHANIINNIISDASINKEYDLLITTKEKNILLETTGKYKFKRNLQINELKGGVEVLLGDAFINAVANLNDNVILHLKTDYPVKIFEKTENTVITVLVAPKTK